MDTSLFMAGRDVLFAHWPVEPEALRPHVPDVLELDTFEGSAWVSALAFEIDEAHPSALSMVPTSSFPHLNFRTYVRFDGEPGVYFLTVDTGSKMGAAFARLVLRQQASNAEMCISERNGEFSFTSRRTQAGEPPARFEATYRPVGEEFTAQPDTPEEFTTERFRYFLPDADADSSTIRVGEISHDPWRLQPVEATIERNSLFRAIGMETPAAEPVVVYSPSFEMTTHVPSRRPVDV